MKTIFFGSGPYVLPILEVLRKNYDLSLVLTTEKLPPSKKGQALQGWPVITWCLKNKIKYISVQQFNNLTIEQLSSQQTPLAVLAYFGLILPKEILEIFPKGILNIHPSLLPKYRGPTPGQSAILSGESKTGVTLIKLDEEVDHGPILAQVEEEIGKDETSISLYKRLFEIGAKLIGEYLPKYIEGKLKLREQNHSQATFTKHLERQSGFFEIENPPPKEKLSRMVRAYYPWPGVWSKLRIKNQELRIKFLPEGKIQVEGKKPVSYKDFLNGYPNSSPVILNKILDLDP